MARIKNKEEKNHSEAKSEVLYPERPEEAVIETEPNIIEKKPAVSDEFKKNIESIELDEVSKEEASIHADEIKELEDEKRIKKLIDLARSKGVIHSINIAKKLKEFDPYILDKLHDALAENELYKNLKF